MHLKLNSLHFNSCNKVTKLLQGVYNMVAWSLAATHGILVFRLHCIALCCVIRRFKHQRTMVVILRRIHTGWIFKSLIGLAGPFVPRCACIPVYQCAICGDFYFSSALQQTDLVPGGLCARCFLLLLQIYFTHYCIWRWLFSENVWDPFRGFKCLHTLSSPVLSSRISCTVSWLKNTLSIQSSVNAPFCNMQSFCIKSVCETPAVWIMSVVFRGLTEFIGNVRFA